MKEGELLQYSVEIVHGYPWKPGLSRNLTIPAVSQLWNTGGIIKDSYTFTHSVSLGGIWDFLIAEVMKASQAINLMLAPRCSLETMKELMSQRRGNKSARQADDSPDAKFPIYSYHWSDFHGTEEDMRSLRRAEF